MKTGKINLMNFDDTFIETQKSEEIGHKTYYLDLHELDGVEYWSVSQDEFLMDAFDDEQEAEAYFDNHIAIVFIARA